MDSHEVSNEENKILISRYDKKKEINFSCFSSFNHNNCEKRISFDQSRPLGLRFPRIFLVTVGASFHTVLARAVKKTVQLRG